MSIHSSWEELDPSAQWQEIVCSNRQDRNYYWQAVNTANELSRWLWNNSPVFRPYRRPATGEEFKVWPDLLVIGYRQETPPRLPIRPETGYGQWWFTTEDWLRHVEEWFPKIGVPLTGEELAGLADALHLQPLASPSRPVIRPSGPNGSSGTGVTTPSTGDVATILSGFLGLVNGLVQRVDTLEERTASLERRLAGLEPRAVEPRAVEPRAAEPRAAEPPVDPRGASESE
jgi:hypothetical protein